MTAHSIGIFLLGMIFGIWIGNSILRRRMKLCAGDLPGFRCREVLARMKQQGYK